MAELTQKQQDTVRALAEEYGAVEDEEQVALLALLDAYEEQDLRNERLEEALATERAKVIPECGSRLAYAEADRERAEAKLSEPVQVFLSRRNLLTLLAKLDKVREGAESKCTLIKHDTRHWLYPQTHPNISITAVEDEDYYVDRMPGWTAEDL